MVIALRLFTALLAVGLAVLGSTVVQQRYDAFMKVAYEALAREDYDTVHTNLEEAVKLQPQDIDANQLLGTVLVKLLDFSRGISFLGKAVELTGWKDPAILSNYIESLRLGREWDKAREVVIKSAFELYPEHPTVLYNSALVARDLSDLTTAADLLQRSARANPKYYQVPRSLPNLPLLACHIHASPLSMRLCAVVGRRHRGDNDERRLPGGRGLR